MGELPSGTVTFLYTDIEGSTARWEQQPQAMRAAVDRHLALLRQVIADHQGHLFRTVGDGVCAAFAEAGHALAAALTAQQVLLAEPWTPLDGLPVRMALHTCAADHQAGDYVGAGLNRLGRLLAIGHGGQVLLSRATEALVRGVLPPAATLRDLGQQRLRDLLTPEQVFQLLHAALPAAFPPLRALDQLPNNLPRQLTSFVGRDQELAEVTRLLAGTPLLTLTGTGGCGKTRLALHLAADRLDDYPDGVWLVELAPLTDPELVARTVASVLQVSETPAQPLLTSLLAALRGKRLLLVLDNCEHLLDACARLADPLLRGCPGLQVLATSREALGIAGETAWRVPSLSLPDVHHLPPVAQLSQYQAVRLFIERAVAARPDFAVTDQNAAAVAQLCWRLDGIPLAIELAAARVTGLSVAQLASRLDQRFRLLTGGSRTALPRQQTLRATIDWSYDLLSAPERVLLRRLAVFAGGCMLEAAEAVCADTELDSAAVLELLLRLVDRSLVQAEDGVGGEQRYRLLETIRQYGHGHLLEAGDGPAVRERHAAWFLGFAERADPELVGPDESMWYRRLDAEHDNLRQALAWYHAEPNGAYRELCLASALYIYWRIRGHLSEGRSWMESALERVESMGAVDEASTDRTVATTRLRALRRTGGMALRQGDLGRAATHVARSAALARELGDWPAMVDSLILLAAIAVYTGDYDASRTHIDEAFVLARQSGHPQSLGDAIYRKGWLLVQLRDFDAARPLIEASLAHNQEQGNQRHADEALSWLGQIDLAEGDLTRARARFTQARDHAEQAGWWRQLGYHETSLGLIARLAGDATLARRHYAAGLPRFRDAGDRSNIAWSLEEWGGLAVAQGQAERAARLFGAAEKLWDDLGMRRTPIYDTYFQRDLASLRTIMSDAALQRAWTSGRALTLEQAIAEALAEASETAT